jgi:DNA-binding NtrC family response regulator
MPPLRERREDIYLLFRKFASDVALQYRMPAVALDADSRRALEEYYWPGNIRQLKNLAEQISAVESTREITADIILKYLPQPSAAGSPNVPAPGVADYNSDREILYKLLFDMRAELFEVKQMLAGMTGRTDAAKNPIAGLLPSSYSATPPAVTSAPTTAHPQPEPLFADSEEVDDPAPMTKEQAQKEAIVKALRRHGGKRKEAAKDLFISERTLYRKIKELGIDEF